MIRNCKNCAGKVVYDIELGGLYCDCCGSQFDVSDFDADEVEEQEAAPIEDIDCQIYSCSSCGAEISVTNTEVSTFCIYCGNPSIVFSRVSKMHKPDMIIPFKVSKQEAMDKVRCIINKGFFIPREIKNYEIEHMRGIYIPYHITNVEYDASMICSSRHKSGKSSVTYYYKRNCYANLPWVTTDASTTLNDSTSQRLEPYYMRGAISFDEDYLVGFYSDMSDVEEEAAIRLAKQRAAQACKDQIMDSFNGSSKKVVKEIVTTEVYDKPITAMLPAWFLTFRYQDEPYTIIVNGQTGKIVGGVPWNRKLFIILLILLAVTLAAVCVFILYNFLPLIFESDSSDDDSGEIIFLPIMIAIACISAGVTKIKGVLKSIKRTNASTLTSYVSKRQTGG